MYLADTTFIIDLIKGDTGALEKAQFIDKNHLKVSIASLTAHEYLRIIYYLFYSDQELLKKKLEKAEGDLARFEIIGFDFKISRESSRIDGTLMATGKIIGLADTIIGATAQFYDLIVLTRNKKHFESIPDLKIESY